MTPEQQKQMRDMITLNCVTYLKLHGHLTDKHTTSGSAMSDLNATIKRVFNAGFMHGEIHAQEGLKENGK